MSDRDAFDLIVVASEGRRACEARLAALLPPHGTAPQQIVVVAARASITARLQAYAEAHLNAAEMRPAPRWTTIACDEGRGEVAALSRALLLGERDVVVSLPGGLPSSTCALQLRRLLARAPRAAAAVPACLEPEAAPRDTARSTPPRLRPPQLSLGELGVTTVGIEAPLFVLRRAVLHLVGGLDPSFCGLYTALCDWAMRAERLGFDTLLGAGATVCVQAALPPVRPTELQGRHRGAVAHLAAQRSAMAARLSQSCRDSGRSGLRVGLDLRHLPEGAINGTGVYGVELCRALRMHTDAQIFVLVATRRQQQALHALGEPCFLEGQQLPEVHVLHRPAQVFEAADLLYLLQSDAPLVLTYQDLIAYRAASAHASGARHDEYRLFSHLSVRAAQRLVAISADNKRDMVATLGVSPGQIDVVHHGVHSAYFAHRAPTQQVQALRAVRPEHSRGCPFYLYVGSDYAHKNLRLLLSAYALVRATDPAPPELWLVGHPSGTLDGAYQVIKDTAPPGVHFLGCVSDEALRALYQTAVALVYPTAYEGFGMPPLEAMAAGCPVICSQFASLPEVVGDAAQRVADLNDINLAAAMRQLRDDAQLRAELRGRGEARARAFTWAQTAKQTYAAYEKALQAPTAVSLHERQMARLTVEALLAAAHPSRLQARLSRAG